MLQACEIPHPIGSSVTLEEDNAPPGANKLGGLPDLPDGAMWPTRRYEYPEEEMDLWSEEDRIDDRQFRDALHDLEVKEPIDDDWWEVVLAPFDGHMLGGWPAVIQDPMELECEMATHGICAGNSEGYADPRVPALEKSAKDWRSLLQIDSDDALDWM